MSPKHDDRFVAEEAEQYWRSVDLYIGGTEHAVGHLLYSRMWVEILFDRGWVSEDEPFRKLVNQGMIQGTVVDRVSCQQDESICFWRTERSV